jgi:hypothetical protein
MKTLTMTIIAATLLCSSSNATPPWMKPADMSNLPANYKTIALAAVKKSLKDPDSVKTLRISETMQPSPLPGGSTGVYVEVNAKNSFGGYTGLSLVVVQFKAGKIVDLFTLSGR